jgi:multiple sugar transport system ATP-binding protein
LGKFSGKHNLKTASGEKALMGIRPSDIELASNSKGAIKSRVHLLEPLGDVTVVSVECGGETLRMVLSESKAQGLKPGDAANITFDTSKIHIFRASSGQAIA